METETLALVLVDKEALEPFNPPAQTHQNHRYVDPAVHLLLCPDSITRNLKPDLLRRCGHNLKGCVSEFSLWEAYLTTPDQDPEEAEGPGPYTHSIKKVTIPRLPVTKTGPGHLAAAWRESMM